MSALHHGQPVNRYEVAIGRTLAFCVHPLAAWRLAQRSIRVRILAGYFAVGYAAIFAALLLL